MCKLLKRLFNYNNEEGMIPTKDLKKLKEQSIKWKSKLSSIVTTDLNDIDTALAESMHANFESILKSIEAVEEIHKQNDIR